MSCQVYFQFITDGSNFPTGLDLLSSKKKKKKRHVPVKWRGEGGHDNITAIDADDVSDGLQDVEVEVRVSWYGAVEASFQERRPLFLQYTL